MWPTPGDAHPRLAAMQYRDPAAAACSHRSCVGTQTLATVAIFLSLLGGCCRPPTSAPQAPAPQAPAAAEPSVTPVPAAIQRPKPVVASEPPSTQATASAEVVGIYEQLNVAQRAEAPPHYVGRVTIRQKDGHSVMLETHDRGVRTADEIAGFEGKRVRVKAAHAVDRCHGWGDGTQATIVGPCLRDIVDISLAAP
jgi:hypothetical protein